MESDGQNIRVKCFLSGALKMFLQTLILTIFLTSSWGQETTLSPPIGPIVPPIAICTLKCAGTFCLEFIPNCEGGSIIGSSTLCDCCHNECVIPLGGNCSLDKYPCAYSYECCNDVCTIDCLT